MSVSRAFSAGLSRVLSANVRGPGASPARETLTASQLAPVVPELELASPWVDSAALSPVTVLSELYGNSTLIPPTRSEAMSVPAIARARNVVCSTLARLELVGAPRAGSQLDDDTRRFLENPAAAGSAFILKLWTVDDFIFEGVSWWRVRSRYASKKPRGVERIRPGGVELDRYSGRTIVKVYGEVVDPADVLRLDGPHEGILNYAGSSIRQARNLERNAARMARNPIPAIDLHQTSGTPITKEERTALITAWRDARDNDESGGVGYTSPNIEAKVLGTPAENFLSRARNTAAIDGARIVSVPADAVDASVEHASMTYANVETRLRVLVDFGLAAYGDALAARLELDDITPRGTRVRVDYSGITAASDADPGTSAPETTEGEQA